MVYIEWEDRYLTGVPEADEDHRKLVGLINRLHEAIQNGRAREGTAEVLAELFQYARTHFHTEESLMQRHGYPDYPAHKRAHQEFIATLEGFEHDLAKGRFVLSLKLLNFMRDWLLDHIVQADKAYGPHLQAARGAEGPPAVRRAGF